MKDTIQESRSKEFEKGITSLEDLRKHDCAAKGTTRAALHCVELKKFCTKKERSMVDEEERLFIVDKAWANALQATGR
jgi:hypothetical protein